MQHDDPRLKAHFDILRQVDARQAPGFDALWAQAQAARPRPRLLTLPRFAVAAAVVVAFGLAVVLWPPTDPVPSISVWTSPTQALLPQPNVRSAPIEPLTPSLAASPLSAWQSPTAVLMPPVASWE